MNLSTHTRVVFSFHTWESNGFDQDARGDLRVPYRVQGFNYQKSFGDAAGQFSLQMKATDQDAESLLDLWDDPEGVWVRLQYQINGVPADICLGNIDTIKESIKRGVKGERALSFTITGRDHGKVFETTETYLNTFERGGQLPSAIMYDTTSEDVEGPPDRIVRALIRSWLGNEEISDSVWTFPPSLYGGRRFYDVLNKTTISQRLRGRLLYMQLLNPSTMEGQLWDAMQEFSNGLLNEMWSDLAPDPNLSASAREKDPVTGAELPVRQLVGLTPAIYLRERPFPTKVEGANRRKWSRLPTHDIYPQDVSGQDLSKGGGANKHNFWILDAQGAQARSYRVHYTVSQETGGDPGDPGGIPIYDIDNIRKVGLRRFMQGTRFLPFNEEDIASIAYATSARWLQLCHDWYAPAPLEISGSLQIARAMPWIRIGHRIRWHRRVGSPIEFYVEGVNHSYTYPQGATTGLTLTRGEPTNRDLLGEIYARREHSDTVGDLEHTATGLGVASETATHEQLQAVREAPDAATARAAAESVDGVPGTPETTQAAQSGGGADEPADMVFTVGEVDALAQQREARTSQETDPDMNHDAMNSEVGFETLPQSATTVDGSERSDNLVRQEDIDIDPTTTTPDPQND